mgnify:CR=1 FL=1
MCNFFVDETYRDDFRIRITDMVNMTKNNIRRSEMTTQESAYQNQVPEYTVYQWIKEGELCVERKHVQVEISDYDDIPVNKADIDYSLIAKLEKRIGYLEHELSKANQKLSEAQQNVRELQQQVMPYI